MPHRTIMFAVPGYSPAPQGSKVPTGRTRTSQQGNEIPILRESSVRLGPWRNTVVMYARQAIARNRLTEPLDGPLRAEVVFTMQPTKKILPADLADNWPDRHQYGDIDKLLRSTFDAIGGAKDGAGVIADDCRIVDVRALKLFPGHPGSLDKPGAVVRITELT